MADSGDREYRESPTSEFLRGDYLPAAEEAASRPDAEAAAQKQPPYPQQRRARRSWRAALLRVGWPT